MKRLFNSDMTSDQARAAFQIELQRLRKDYGEKLQALKEDYVAATNVILQREAPPDGSLWLTENELPLTVEELYHEWLAAHKISVLVIREDIPHYGEIVDGELFTDDDGTLIVALEDGGMYLFEGDYEDLWIAFRAKQEEQNACMDQC